IVPNKDFILRWRVAGDQIKAAMFTHSRDDGDGHFTLMITPPASMQKLKRHPLELIFVVDASGSMNGKPIEQAKAAMHRGLDSLQPHDTFQVIQFSNTASQFGPRPVPATPQNIRKAQSYVRKLSGGGGTHMLEGVKTALDFPHDEERLRFVIFLTDGYIGN